MSLRIIRKISSLIFLAILSACSTTNEVVFVTKSSLSIAEIETTPAEVNVGYSRIEGYLAPAYENGALPPVVSSMRTDGSLFSPKVQQLYATGEAANLLASGTSSYDYSKDENEKLKGEKEGMFFGTSTNLGFKIGITQENPSLNIGYKRIEASYIPLGTSGEGDDEVDIYPSVIASIDTTIPAGEALAADPSGLRAGQYFATGTAAKIMATKGHIQTAFEDKAKSSLETYREEVTKQNESALQILTCAAWLSDDKWPQAIEAAKASNLLLGLGDEITSKWAAYESNKTTANRQEVLKLYYAGIADVDGSKVTYTTLLEAHRKLVCSLK